MNSYLDALNYILENGDYHHDRTGTGTLSVFGYQTKYDLRSGFPLLTTKKMFIRGIVEELIWFLNGRTDNQWLKEKGVKIWDAWATEEQCAKFGRKEGDLGPIYGHMWRAFSQEYRGPRGWPNMVTEPDGSESQHGVIEYGDKGDQIKSLIKEINKNPGSRRLIVTGWNPLAVNAVALCPCHTMFQCKVIEKEDGKYLDLQLYQRSQDVILGAPFNIASYALLNHLIATVCNLKPRNLIISVGDMHIYSNHMEQAKLQLTRTPFKLPTIEINQRLAGGGFDALLDFKYEDLTVHNYQCHPAIKAPVAV